MVFATWTFKLDTRAMAQQLAEQFEGYLSKGYPRPSAGVAIQDDVIAIVY